MSIVTSQTPGSLALVWTGASTADIIGLLKGGASDTAGRIEIAALGAVALIGSMLLLGYRISRRLDAIAASKRRGEDEDTRV